MLRIIGKRLSYVLTTTLSIPELPPDAVELVQPRHEKAGHELVRIPANVSELVRQHRAHDADLEMEVINSRIRHRCHGDRSRALRQWVERLRAILVRERREHAEISA